MFTWWQKHAMLHLIELELFQVSYYGDLWDPQVRSLRDMKVRLIGIFRHLNFNCSTYLKGIWVVMKKHDFKNTSQEIKLWNFDKI